MNDPQLAALLESTAQSSQRLRFAMGLVAIACVLIAVGIASDGEVWHSGPGWRIAATAGVCTFGAIAALSVYSAFWRQPRHIALLRDLLSEHPQQIRSISVRVAGAVPVASWSPDNGSSSRGLHIVIRADSGATWILPVSRPQASDVVAALAHRCPHAVIES